MVEIRDKQILINGKPRLILSGEIHYYRLKREDWQDRIIKLKEAGFNTVATYIPWICHEEQEGIFDFGSEREELDLAAFIKLCAENDLYFIARPGPFIMAEMKNEGIPHWLIEKYPEIVPVTWDGEKVSTFTLDYLAPKFLEAAKRWYKNVCGILEPFLSRNGGNLIGMQLDNEIGMLSWVSNSPDLTDTVITDMMDWLKKSYQAEELKRRYPFAIDEINVCRKHFIKPEESYSLMYHQDLGNYMRYRIMKYVAALKEYANEYGIKEIPFLVNIHGTSAGRCLTYPVGISQLYKAYTMSKEYLSGSDIYIGSLTMQNFQDLYLINTYMESVNLKDQPLASFEFECGDSNYGETFGGRNDVSAADFKTRMCIAQGNRLLNCYLFCGGENYLLKKDYKDGNNRIATTGKRHGFAAPVSPEGELNYTYPRMARAMKIMAALEEKIVTMYEVRDSLAFSFLPDYYMTEYCYEKSELAKKEKENLTRYRGGSGFECLTRAALLNNYCFTSIELQDKEIPKQIRTIVVLSASYMAEQVQKKLADFVKQGGGLLMYGALPVMNMEGETCTILKDLLEVKKVEEISSGSRYWLSAEYREYLKKFAEIRIGFAQTYEVENALTLMCTADNYKTCVFEKKAGLGTVIMVSADLNCNLDVVRILLERLKSTPSFAHTCPYHGIFMTMMENKAGEQLLHILNLDTFEKKAILSYQSEELFDGKELTLMSGDGLMLPINLTIDNKKIKYSTAEIYHREKTKWTLRLTQEEDIIVFIGEEIVKETCDYIVEEKNGFTYVTSKKNGKTTEFLDIYFNLT